MLPARVLHLGLPTPALPSILGAIVLLPASGLAQPLPSHLSYHALSPECPSKEQFIADVKAQLAPADEEDPRQFVVSLGSRRGILEVRDEVGPTATRVIDGEDCSDTEGAIAFSTAMILREPPPRFPVIWHWSFGGGGIGLFDAVPEPALGPTIFASIAPDRKHAGWPEFRLWLAYARTVASYTYGSRWQWIFARAEACPLVARLYGLDASLCVGLDLGEIQSEGTALSVPHAEWRFWMAPSVGLRLAWQPLEAVAFELNAGVLFPVSRYRYMEDREAMDQQPSPSPVWRVPNVGQTLVFAVRYGRRDQIALDRQ